VRMSVAHIDLHPSTEPAHLHIRSQILPDGSDHVLPEGVGQVRLDGRLIVWPEQRCSSPESEGVPLVARRRVIRLATLITLLSVSVANVSIDRTAHAEESTATGLSSPDFRMRVNAALELGQTKAPDARRALEAALYDIHPAVRIASAAGLAALGDARAVAALERRHASESEIGVRNQITESLKSLRAAVGAVTARNAKYFVQIGAMRGTSVSANESHLSALRAAARTHAGTLSGAFVIDEKDAGALRIAKARHVPVLRLDGQITELSQNNTRSAVSVRAKVEFTLRRLSDQTLRGALVGSAAASDLPAASSSRARMVELESQAVGGAVESALRGSSVDLLLAAK